MATILLVDDDVDLVEMYKAVLAHRGHDVRSACSAQEARLALEAARPDAVILDVMMESDTAGFHLAREVQQRYPGLPTVILSGIHAASGVPWRFAPDEDWLPVVKFLDKPVQPVELAEEIERILGSNASGHA